MRPLLRYLLAAILARGADAGAAIGLLLHCLALGDRIAQPVLTGSVLTAAIAAPHLVGPVLARWMDAARDSRRVLARPWRRTGCFWPRPHCSSGGHPWCW